MRSRRAGLTREVEGRPRSAADTACLETLAREAISFKVTRIRPTPQLMDRSIRRAFGNDGPFNQEYDIVSRSWSPVKRWIDLGPASSSGVRVKGPGRRREPA